MSKEKLWNKKLYHGTPYFEYNLENIKHFWTSYDYRQSGLHIFESMCNRYNKFFFNDKMLWPIIDEYTPKRDLKLLKIELLSNDSYRIYDYIQGILESKPIEEFIEQYGININDISYKFDDDCKKPLNLSYECNKKILLIIEDINKKYNKNYDGYICDNDEHEIALINPNDILTLTKRYELININSNSLNDIYIYTDDCTRDTQSYNIFLGMYYQSIINELNSYINKFIIKKFPITGNIKFDLSNIKLNIDKTIHNIRRNNTNIDISNQINDINNIVSNYLDYETFISSDRECFKKINLKLDLDNLTKREKNLIYRSYICNEGLVSYQKNGFFKITKLMKANGKLKLTFINTESKTDLPLIIEENPQPITEE